MRIVAYCEIVDTPGGHRAKITYEPAQEAWRYAGGATEQDVVDYINRALLPTLCDFGEPGAARRIVCAAQVAVDSLVAAGKLWVFDA